MLLAWREARSWAPLHPVEGASFPRRPQLPHLFERTCVASGRSSSPRAQLLRQPCGCTRDRNPCVPAPVEQVVEFFLEREAGEAMIGEVREDEPSLAEELRVTGDIVKSQQLLRHESIATTQIYLHPNQYDLADAMRAADDSWAAEEASP
jgi:hypothetical protein